MSEPSERDTAIRGHLDDAEKALRGVRQVLREVREAPIALRQDLEMKHRQETAKLCYRLNRAGVSGQIIARALGVTDAQGYKVIDMGEVLTMQGSSREERIRELLEGGTLRDSGLFSGRVLNALTRAKIETLAQLREYTPERLVDDVAGVGEGAVREIRKVLRELGADLKRSSSTPRVNPKYKRRKSPMLARIKREYAQRGE